jgi:uncharacterized protein DUF3175
MRWRESWPPGKYRPGAWAPRSSKMVQMFINAIKMVQMFINRSGINLSAARKRELEKAKRILQHKLHAKSVAK